MMTGMDITFGAAGELAQRTVADARHPHLVNYTLDALWVLYDRVLRVDPQRPDDPGRDRLLLSKGHNPSAFYAILAAKGFIPAEWLETVAAFDSPLGSHPDATLVPGVEISSGSLGHGLPLGVGLALGLRATGHADAQVHVLVGDGELDEGSNHEAAAYAGAIGLSNLNVVVADNGSAAHGRPGLIASRFEAEGWSSAAADMGDHEALYRAFTTAHPDRPHVTVATFHS
jgi:transketolase